MDPSFIACGVNSLLSMISVGLPFKRAGADAVFIEAPETKEEMLGSTCAAWR
jgi:hypothetical protein